MAFIKQVATVALAASTLLSSFTNAAPITIAPVKRDLKFAYGTDKVRGVNLGGWFVLEPWITPSIFAAQVDTVVDEFTLCQTLGSDAALSILQSHWNTWITQTDIQNIANAGFNYVRIPIGYWSISPLEGDPYVQGAYDVLGQALDWCDAAGIKALVDIHGAPGSQNGFDNSGRRGAITWTQGDTTAQTLAAVQQLQNDHGSHPALASVEPINEPMGPALGLDAVESYYSSAYDVINTDNVLTTFHDAFEGPAYWNDFLGGEPNIMMDTHHYEVFDAGQLGMSTASHVGSACGFGASIAQDTKWTITGEWTGAMTDCAQWLNGRGVGARYDGTFNYNGQSSSYIGSCDGFSTGSASSLSATDQQAIRMFVEAQMDAYEESEGWVWWTWKTEGAPGWDAQDLIASGLFPQPLTDRQYPGQCG